METVTRPAPPLAGGAPDDLFVSSAAGTLTAAGFPATQIAWLDLPAAVAAGVAAAMGPASPLEASS